MILMPDWKAAAWLLGALALTGCERELATHDAVTPTLGNAVRMNATLQAVRSPDAVVKDTSLHSDGVVTAQALDRYRAGGDDGGVSEAEPPVVE